MSEQPKGNVRRPTGHEMLLAWALTRTKGPVLELGVGMGSTPWLHFWCAADNHRQLVSVENNPKWHKLFNLCYDNDWHQLEWVAKWEDCARLDEPWSVVLLDCAPAEARRYCLERLRSRCDYIVVHDWASSPKYGVGKVEKDKPFKSFWLDKSLWPYTAILSDTKEIDIAVPAI